MDVIKLIVVLILVVLLRKACIVSPPHCIWLQSRPNWKKLNAVVVLQWFAMDLQIDSPSRKLLGVGALPERLWQPVQLSARIRLQNKHAKQTSNRPYGPNKLNLIIPFFSCFVIGGETGSIVYFCGEGSNNLVPSANNRWSRWQNQSKSREDEPFYSAKYACRVFRSRRYLRAR